MTMLRIALRVLRVDRRTRTSAILTGVGVAVATALMLILVSLPGAAQARVDRAAWQELYIGGVGVTEDTPMLLAASEDFYEGHKITRVDVAATGDPSAIDLPAGIERFPAPGEVLMSPALRELSGEVPGSVLGERYPGEVVGVLGTEALTHPGQLVVLVGHTEDELAQFAMPVGGFAPAGMVSDAMLDLLAGVGVVVLLVPSLVLVASAARLTASRRERRLAALRLAGATPGQVVGMAAAENAIAAVGGALLGLAVSPLARWAVSHVPWDGGTWQASDFVTSPALTASVVIAIPLLVLAAAVFGLWRVVRTPLGAANAQRPKRPHWARLLSVPVAAAVFFAVVANPAVAGGPLVLFGAMGLLIGSSMLVGPWVTAAIGSVFSRVWRRPSVLLAGRRLRHDPKGAYRSSAGVVLAVFTGSMALTLLPSLETLAGSSSPFRDSVLYANAGTEAKAVAERTDAALARYGVGEAAEQVKMVELVVDGAPEPAMVVECDAAARLLRTDMAGACEKEPGVYATGPIRLGDDAGVAMSPGEQATPLPKGTPVHRIRGESDGVDMLLLIDPAALPANAPPSAAAVVAVSSTPETTEVVRTALGRAANGQHIHSVTARLANQQAQLDDLRRVTVIGLAIAALLSGCSAAITTAGSVMDRRRTFGALMAAGTPARVLSRALRTEAAMPALVATIGAGALGVAVGISLFGLISVTPPMITPWVSAPVVLGVVAALIAASVCAPALKRVSSEPLSDD
ncbi:FtsX-like permease family protein [Saccharomonospora xinjiangensis]|uniref:FtsX-like permease family protein n=1 Tax=Saccharomonospora xinjiangensis TaxID=75294 RepID=UPI001070429A|nr:FtsX-like permease family protein [Saccharomonospora xinjiangensis]